MSGYKLSGVHTSVAVDITPGVEDGICFGAVNGKLCIGISSQSLGQTCFVALGGDVLDLASHKLADALGEIAALDARLPRSVQ